MNDQIGDRADTDAGTAVEPQERRRAIAIRLADGRWFRGWKPRGGGVIAVQQLAHAQYFAPASKALEQARAKLRKNGIDAVPEEITLVIGRTPAN